MRRLAALFVIAALAIGALGAGVGASYLDSATAVQHINVGTFQCQVSSTDTRAVIAPDGHTVTFTLPPIMSSTAGSSFVQDLTVSNTGSMAMLVHWTFAYAGTVQWQPANSDPTKGSFTFYQGTGSVGSATNMATDFVLAPGTGRTYGAGGYGVGFGWTTLGNGDFGDTAQVTATANCSEPPQSKISFVGASDMLAPTGTAKKVNSVACPVGSPMSGSYPWVSSHLGTAAQPNGQSTLGSNLITSISSMTGIAVGQIVQSGTAWPTSPPYATVTAVGPGSQVTVSQAAIGTNYGNVMFQVDAQWCGNNTFPVSTTLASWPSSGSFTVTASGGSATVTYTGTQTSPYFAFTGLTNTSSATGSVTPGSNNVVQILAPATLTLPSGWAVGDTAVVINVGTGAAVPAGYTGIGTAFGNYGKSKIGYKVLTSGDGSIPVPVGSGASMAVAVYRGVAGIAPELGYAGDPGSVALGVPALTLTIPSGTSWVVGLLGSASTSVDGLSLSGMTTRSGSFVGPRAGVFDTGKGVTSWPGATGGPVAAGDEWAVELLSN